MQRCKDAKMQRCKDVKIQRCKDVKMQKCKDEKSKSNHWQMRIIYENDIRVTGVLTLSWGVVIWKKVDAFQYNKIWTFFLMMNLMGIFTARYAKK